MNKQASCDFCGRPQKQLARHKSTCPNRTIERRCRIGSVLQECGIGSADIDWDLDLLDKLPNLRHQTSCDTHHYTRWKQIDSEMPRLPTLSRFLLRLHRLACSSRRFSITADVFQGDQVVLLDGQEAWTDWINCVLEGKQSSRVLNMETSKLILKDEESTYRNEAEKIVSEIFDLDETVDLGTSPATINITPRLTKTDVHHDSLPHISTAIGQSDVRKPLKLWIIWPSTEIDWLTLCYGNTSKALQLMQNACFYVQMQGESIVVPPNSPHAVLALNDCFLYGHQFSNLPTYDPSTVHVDIAGRISPQRACEIRLQDLRRGLAVVDEAIRSNVAHQFIQTWATDAKQFSRFPSLYDKVVKLWADDLEDSEECLWCEHEGFGDQQHISDSIAHMRCHLDGVTVRRRPRKQSMPGEDEYQECTLRTK